jgi:RNA polymerase sigma-70 factor (ECF subfamily)
VAVALDFTTLVEEHGDYLYRVALRHFPERHRAEELVQETFVAAVEAAERFRGHASPRTWLTSILRHKIIDTIRRRVREEPPRLEATESLDEYFERKAHWRPGAEPQPWQTSPETLPSQKEFFVVLKECLTGIPETQRQVFILREMEELDSDEICNTMCLSSTNVRVLLHRARLALRKCLEQNWFGKGGDSSSLKLSSKRGAQ